MKKTLGLFLTTLILSSTAFAQGIPDAKVPQGENLAVPEGWEIRLDRPAPDVVVGSDAETADIFFVNMTPGWHITTGPRAIFYHPESVVSSDFKIKSLIHLFDTKGRDREGFGLFFGGKNLQEDSQEYLYFLIRNTGDFLVKARKGSETENIIGWTASDTIVKYVGGDDPTGTNELTVEVVDGMIKFHINGTEVSSISTDGWVTDGIFGLRVNHQVNLHIEDLSVE